MNLRTQGERPNQKDIQKKGGRQDAGKKPYVSPLIGENAEDGNEELGGPVRGAGRTLNSLWKIIEQVSLKNICLPSPYLNKNEGSWSPCTNETCSPQTGFHRDHSEGVVIKIVRVLHARIQLVQLRASI